MVGFAISIPIILGLIFNQIGIGLALCFGAFWSSPSNTQGSFRQKTLGILFSAALVTLVSFAGSYLKVDLWLLIPLLGLFTFAIAYISVYGFRASLISFSGLLALVLGFAHTPESLAPYQYSLLIGTGGLWYLLLVYVAHLLNPKAQTEESFSETFDLTATFLKMRATLLGRPSDRAQLVKQLHQVQTDLIEHHETLRDILISARKTSGNSRYQNKQLLIFIQLVEILETAVANPVDYNKLNTLFVKHPKLRGSFQEIIFELSNILKSFANNKKNTNDITCSKISSLLETVSCIIKPLDNPEEHEEYIILHNFLEYQRKQFEKLERIQWLKSNPKLKPTDYLDTEKLKRFLVPQDYDFKTGVRNFTFKSAIFKHSLRLSVTMMVGYLVGILLEFQNPYWILLTIIVIMRPSYGLTKARSKDRIIGTLIGAIISAGIVLFIDNNYVLGSLGIITLVIAFSVVQKNYKASATFVTLSVVFIYAILSPDILLVIQYRIFDTAIGAALSFMAIKWLWPAWGFLEIKKSIQTSVTANTAFFNHIATIYIDKTAISTSYRLARKKAFLETSNLNAAFQRMAQEPVSKQKNIDSIYELVVLNHTMLSALASLSTYLQHHQTTPASTRFKEGVKAINKNLNDIIKSLDSVTKNKNEALENQEELTDSEQRLINLTFKDVEEMILTTPDQEKNYKEAHLIWEQLRWLHSISRKMRSLLQKSTL